MISHFSQLTNQVTKHHMLNENSVIQFVDNLILYAEQHSASDIHLEPYEQFYRTRYRQDGILYEATPIPLHLASRVITRIKVMANLDISERRLPQDGHFKITLQLYKTIDIRVSTCPTLHGEKIVLRLLDSTKMTLAINKLGLTSIQESLFLRKINQPQGLILVTGPTGSGKTVTLYSALNYLNTRQKNILTVEDPIEIQLDGINQVSIHPKTGLNFANILRAFLRQDPDIIMVGEIRDRESAAIALQAAQTGHLVLSTLHTNSAVETIARLIAMGIAPYQLAHTLILIIAQRLIRKLCPTCKQIEVNPASDSNRKIFCAYGCKNCNQGYLGRTAIFECLDITETLSELILKKTHPHRLLKTASAQGFTRLEKIGIDKIYQGETSLAELQRVITL